MEFVVVSNIKARKQADLLVLPFFKVKQRVERGAEFSAGFPMVEIPIETKDFKGKEGEVLILYSHGKQEKRVAMLGLGEPSKVNVEKLRRAYGSLIKACLAKKIATVNLLLPVVPSLPEEDIIKGVSEGLLLANYAFMELKHESIRHEPPVLVQKVSLIGEGKSTLATAEKYAGICEGVYLARDLVNGNADDVNPQYLCKIAENLAKKQPHVKTTVLGKKQIEHEKMGLLLAVNRGSCRDPALILIDYKGNPKSKDRTVLVGKGITFDTGGLNLKTAGGMETMKCDMGGAAVVLGVLHAIAKIGLKVNVTGVIPTTENMIGSKSYKPGDVYKSYSGKTVEIGNTDAEGRLILADALAYACKTLKPARIIDFATLTGAVEVALGAETSGLMSNNDALADALLRSSRETFERTWRMPLFEEYRDQLKSDIADIKNTGGRGAGCITAAMFLKDFIEDVPWAHFDIAGVSYLSEARRYHPKFGTGIGVRLMVNFLEHLRK